MKLRPLRIYQKVLGKSIVAVDIEDNKYSTISEFINTFIEVLNNLIISIGLSTYSENITRYLINLI